MLLYNMSETSSTLPPPQSNPIRFSSRKFASALPFFIPSSLPANASILFLLYIFFVSFFLLMPMSLGPTSFRALADGVSLEAKAESESSCCQLSGRQAVHTSSRVYILI